MDATEIELIAEATARIDYLKFIVKTDEREFQERYLPTIRSIDAWLTHKGHKPGKLTPLGVGTDGLRRYCLEYWGNASHHAAFMIPTTWYNVMYRLDIREEVPEIDSDDLRAMQAYIAVRPSGRTSTSTFTTRPATKTNQRDVGGLGIRFGSRKSDTHAVLYKRGQERTAFEFRIMGKTAQGMGRSMALMEGPLSKPECIASMISQTRHMGRQFLMKTMNVNRPALLMQLADEAQAYMPMLFDKGNAEELAEAEAWWTSLSEEEQIEWQRQGFGPTLKGQKD